MKWLTGLFTRARTEIGFRFHDHEARLVELQNVTSAFPTEHLERDLREARCRLDADLEQRFDGPMRVNRASLASMRAVESSLAAEHATLTRDHAGELKDAYAQLERLKPAMEHAKRAVREASADLKAAKARISSWHSRSRSRMAFYGKRGKSIPQHSFLVFSHSDLDSAKRDAGRAAERIGDKIRDRDRVYFEMRRCGDQIGEIKASRARRRELIEAGRTRAKVVAESAALQSEVVRLTGAEGRMRALRDRYVSGSQIAVEIRDLEARIRDAHARRRSRMADFDGAAERAARRDAYRVGDEVRGPARR